ncbi:hypothetical protein D3C81_549540 [compost metagenome]
MLAALRLYFVNEAPQVVILQLLEKTVGYSLVVDGTVGLKPLDKLFQRRNVCSDLEYYGCRSQVPRPVRRVHHKNMLSQSQLIKIYNGSVLDGLAIQRSNNR